MNDVDTAARALWNARQECRPIAPLTATWPTLSLAEAYAIQHHNIRRALAEGPARRVVGYKIGITSVAVQTWLGVDQPDFGTLLDAMSYPDGGTISVDSLCQPRIEGEIAFVLERPLCGPGLTELDVIRATAFVQPALEIIDSAIADWKITIGDTIADNASSAAFVLGGVPRSVRDIDLVTLGATLRKNGAVVSTGAGAASLGHPARAVAWLANTLGRAGITLEPGAVVLSGALSPVVPIAAGDAFDLAVSGLGTCRVSAVGSDAAAAAPKG